jgi:hypothetical protein
VLADDAKEQRADEAGATPRAGQNQDEGTQELTLANSSTATLLPQAEAAGRPWPWGLIVAVAVLLLAILFALLVLSRPASAHAERETAGAASLMATAGLRRRGA